MAFKLPEPEPRRYRIAAVMARALEIDDAQLPSGHRPILLSRGRKVADTTAVNHQGPTQGDYSGANRWDNKPLLASALRAVVLISPTLLSFAATNVFSRRVPRDALGMPLWTWWLLVGTIGIVVLFATDRAMRQLLPLVALFKLSLVFPDQAPSRFSVAMRSGSTRKLERQVRELREKGLGDDSTAYAERMLHMVAALSVHDRLTRGHCERVRAYTDMIADELGLSDDDKNKLRWASLLHDVGKLFVPADILNKDGRPTDLEWEILKSHTWQGDQLIGPLKPWLGEWAAAVGSHHERWDGEGYPQGLKGEQIHIGARIVAVADTFDVITSKRSYKQPLTAEQARSEIARCAGTQFDPRVARAFLNLGLGRLRFAIGPLSWLANLPAAGQAAVAPVTSPMAAAVVAIATTGAAVASGNTGIIATSDAPENLAFTMESSATELESPPETTVVVTTTVPQLDPKPTTPSTLSIGSPSLIPTLSVEPISTDEDVPVDFTIDVHTFGGASRLSISPPPQRGTVELSQSVIDTAPNTMQTDTIDATYLPAADANGTDSFTIHLCDDAGGCASTPVRVRVADVNDAPRIAAPNRQVVTAGDQIQVTPIISDVEGDRLDVVVSGLPDGVEYSPNSGAITGQVATTAPAGNYTVTIAVTDSGSPARRSTATFEIIVIDPAVPQAFNASVSVAEDSTGIVTLEAGSSAGSATLEILSVPTSGSLGPLSAVTTTPGSPTLSTATLAYTPLPDFFGTDEFTFQACDVRGQCSTATVTLTITNRNDAPVVASLPTATFNIGDPVDIDVVWSDIDDTRATVTVRGLPTGVSYDPASQKITGIVANNAGGRPYPVTITATDDAGAAGSSTFDVIVGVRPPRRVPHAASMFEDTTADIVLSAVTETGALAFHVTSNQAIPGTATIGIPKASATFGVRESVTTILSFTPDADVSGNFTISVTACDDFGSCDEDEVSVAVEEVNDAPRTTPQSESGLEDTEVVLLDAAVLATVDDPDDTNLVVQWVAVNAGSFADNGDRVTITPPDDFVGVIDATYEVCDAKLACTLGTVAVAFAAVNDAPAVEAVADQVVSVFDDVSLQIQAVDIDSSTLVYSATELPVGLSIDPDTGLISGSVAREQVADSYNVTVTVADEATTASVSFVWEVSPYLGTSINTWSVAEDTPSSRVITVYSTIGTMNYTLTQPAAHGTFTLLSTTSAPWLVGIGRVEAIDVRYVPEAEYSGPDEARFSICSVQIAGYCEEVRVPIDVRPSDDPPVPAADTAPTVLAGTPLTYSVAATDVDSATLFYTAAGLPDGLVLNATTGVITGQLDPSVVGQTLQFEVNVSDGTTSMTSTYTMVVDQWMRDPQAGQLIISEVRYAPDILGDLEFVELFNAGATPVDLTGIVFSDFDIVRDNPDIAANGANDSVVYSIPSTDHTGLASILEPGSYATIWIGTPDGWSQNWSTPLDDLEYAVSLTRPVLWENDGVWLTRNSNAAIAYVEWQNASVPSSQVGLAPSSVLALWDGSEVQQLGGATSFQSIALALMSEPTLSACWEHTGGGTAAATCPGAAVTAGRLNSPQASPGQANVL